MNLTICREPSGGGGEKLVFIPAFRITPNQLIDSHFSLGLSPSSLDHFLPSDILFDL